LRKQKEKSQKAKKQKNKKQKNTVNIILKKHLDCGRIKVFSAWGGRLAYLTDQENSWSLAKNEKGKERNEYRLGLKIRTIS